MITPSVGRMLWFYPAGSDPAKDQPSAAIIAHVHSDTCVNLFAIGGDGVPYAVMPQSVLLVQDDPPPAGGNYCTWMPYQREVASGKVPPTQHAQPESKPDDKPEDDEPHAKKQHHHKKGH